MSIQKSYWLICIDLYIIDSDIYVREAFATLGFETLGLCADLGKGNLMLTLTGGPDTNTLPVGKNHGEPARYIKLEVTLMRQTRYILKYAS